MSDLMIAVHCLVFLNHHKKVCSSSQLASNLCIPSSKVRKIMCKIEKAKMIKNIMGKNGGYELIVDVQNINLYDILEVLQTRIINTKWFTGDENAHCLISSNIRNCFELITSDANTFLVPFLKSINLIDIEKNLFNKKGV